MLYPHTATGLPLAWPVFYARVPVSQLHSTTEKDEL
jgi:hypothetical protein